MIKVSYKKIVSFSRYSIFNKWWQSLFCFKYRKSM